MELQLDILRAIAEIRNPVLDGLFLVITAFGEETLFLACAIIALWCIDKKEGYFILFTALFGLVINQFMKLVFRVPRPWVYDPTFKPIDSALAEAGGYSFPSGHTQNASGTFFCIAAYNHRRRPLVIVCIVIALLVAFSRMYLGVHTLNDIILPLFISLAIVLILRPFFTDEKRFNAAFPIVCLVSVAFAVLYVIYVHSISSNPDLDPHNLASGMKSAYTLIGCVTAIIPIYLLDKFLIKFDTGASWYVQIIKVAVGFGLVMAIKVGLSAPLVNLFGNEYIARAVRYFILVMVGGALWPASFRYLSRISIKPLDRFGEWAASKVRACHKG